MNGENQFMLNVSIAHKHLWGHLQTRIGRYDSCSLQSTFK